MKRILEIVAPSGYEPEIGAAIWMLDDTRRRTLELLEDLPEVFVDQPVNENTIGTILYHIALIEADWLYSEILEQPISDDVMDLFPDQVRDQDGFLSKIKGFSLEEHLFRLSEIRKILKLNLSGMTLEDFHRKRILDAYEVSPQWVLHHLSQHEAEHRGELGSIITLIKK